MTALAVVGLVAGTLLATSSVLAVHDEGVFELEGNAVAGNTGVGTGSDPANPASQPAGGEDWDAVFAGTDTAEATAFVTDTTVLDTLAGAGDSILSTNTKDIQEIIDWDWKQTTTTSVQDKADIEHAYAAQYIVPNTGDQCGTLVTTVANCVLLYFGADRFSNSGDTVMGFWFFKDEVSAVGPDATGNGTFDGDHTARNGTDKGDILVVADFRAGGKAPSIQVYEWVTSGGSASTNLDLIGGGPSTAGCTQSPPEGGKLKDPVPPVSGPDNFCATANQFVVSSPWPFLAKDNSGGTTGDGGSDTTFGVAEFMEGGINMTALGLGNTCFSTFMAETRASHSVTSTLSDFALGNFGACSSTFATQTSKTTLVLGEAAPTDDAILDVSGGGGSPPAPTGTVSFYLCGPSATQITVCDPTGLTAFSTKSLTGVTPTGSQYKVTSDAPTISAAGYYCFAATWPGDSNYTDGPYGDDGTNECFQVTVITTSTSTVQKWTPNDSATISTAGPVGYNLTGSVKFELFGPNDTACAGTAKYEETVAIPASSGLSKTVSTTNGDGSGTGLAADFFVVAANEGTYSWRVTYTPAASDTSHTGSGSACNAEHTAVDITQ
jgi:hypothetical protein